MIPLEGVGKVPWIAHRHLKAPDVHSQSKIRGGLPPKDKATPSHITFNAETFGGHLCHKVWRQIHSTIWLFRSVKNVVMELLSNVEITSFHAGLQTPNIRGSGWQEEGGSKDQRV
jgi:hypothetical protein